MNTQDSAGFVGVADMAVVGAGAAGLMTAIQAARLGLKVLLLDGRDKIGAKILMSGGTRCNVTNQAVSEKDYTTGAPHTVRAALKAFTPEETIAFFAEIGVELKLEPTGKYFPVTDRAQDVLDALVAEARRARVALVTGCKVLQVIARTPEASAATSQRADSRANSLDAPLGDCFVGADAPSRNDGFVLSGDGFSYQAKTVVLTTGGLSFPTTGSDGSGYKIARGFGHTLIPTTASLTPLLTSDPDWKSLSGITVPVRLTLWIGEKKALSVEGSFLFTHFGFSGPAPLDISRHWIRADRSKGARVEAMFFPEFTEEQIAEDLRLAVERDGNRTVRAWVDRGGLPARLTETILYKADIDSGKYLAYLKKNERARLLASMCRSDLAVNGDMGYAKAEVTAGGVDLAEISRTTLESKLQPRLFFAGEIVDVDGRIGGFNFQWAWSSGTVAARAAAKQLLPGVNRTK